MALRHKSKRKPLFSLDALTGEPDGRLLAEEVIRTIAHPVSILVDTFGTGHVEETKIQELVKKHFDLRPAGIIEMLDLLKPHYRKTAAYGHFGRTDVDLPWERTDKAAILKAEAGL